MKDNQPVSDGRPPKIHMGTSYWTQDSDAVIQIPVWLDQRVNKTPCKTTHQALTKRKLKWTACGHSQTHVWIHVVYYGVLTAAGTMSLWLCRGEEPIGFVDCTFNAVSALTASGLSSVLLRGFTPLGLFTLMVLMLLGNTAFVSLLPVCVRRFQLFRHDTALNASNAAAVELGFTEHNTAGVNCVAIAIKKTPSNTERDALDIAQTDGTVETGDEQGDGLDVCQEAKSETLVDCSGKSRKEQEPSHEIELLERQAIKKTPSNTERDALDISQTDGTLETGDEQGDGLDVCPEAKSETLVDRCGKSCKSEQESSHEIELLERQALVTLSWLVPIYILAIMSFGFVCIICYTSFSSRGSSRVRAIYEAEEVNPILTAMFLSISAFSNTGLSPLDENMVPFAGAPLVLVPLAVLILAGNVMFPPSLRFLIWGISTLKRPDDPQRKVYDYLLQFPRRSYTHLFPPVHTLWLVATVVAFNAVNLVAFCALEWNSAAVSSNAGVTLMDGLFQSLNSRSGGFYVLSLSSLSRPLLVLYTAMMYIAAYPVFLSRQDSRLARADANQFSNKSMSEKFEETCANTLSLQFTKLFSRDSACLFVLVFLICTVEIRSMNSDPLNYSIFSIVFEVISAYGSVGLSLGYSCERWVQASSNTPYAEAAAACKDVPYSFSGKWSEGSKLILVGCMLLGRHRSLHAVQAL